MWKQILKTKLSLTYCYNRTLDAWMKNVFSPGYVCYISTCSSNGYHARCLPHIHWCNTCYFFSSPVKYINNYFPLFFGGRGVERDKANGGADGLRRLVRRCFLLWTKREFPLRNGKHFYSAGHRPPRASNQGVREGRVNSCCSPSPVLWSLCLSLFGKTHGIHGQWIAQKL